MALEELLGGDRLTLLVTRTQRTSGKWVVAWVDVVIPPAHHMVLENRAPYSPLLSLFLPSHPPFFCTGNRGYGLSKNLYSIITELDTPFSLLYQHISLA